RWQQLGQSARGGIPAPPTRPQRHARQHQTGLRARRGHVPQAPLLGLVLLPHPLAQRLTLSSLVLAPLLRIADAKLVPAEQEALAALVPARAHEVAPEHDAPLQALRAVDRSERDDVVVRAVQALVTHRLA